MATIKLTSKRQATLPVQVCQELGIATGDKMELLPLHHNNQKVWVLKPVLKSTSPWIGSLSHFAAQAKSPWTREGQGELTGRAMARDSGR